MPLSNININSCICILSIPVTATYIPVSFISKNERLRDIQFSFYEIKVLTTLVVFFDVKNRRLKLNNKDCGSLRRHRMVLRYQVYPVPK